MNLTFWRIINTLTLLKAANPDLRVGQIVVNAVGGEPFFVSDEALADALEAMLKEEM